MIKRVLLGAFAVAVAAVVVLNWTYGRLPAEPPPGGAFVQAAGMRIHYLEHPGRGVPVLLIHGLPGTAHDFDAVTAQLRGRRTIAIDRPGFGYSSGGYAPYAQQLRAYAGEELAAGGVVAGVDRGLHSIRTPAIVIQGKRDQPVAPLYGRRLAAALPDARLVMVSGGHMVPYTHPAAVAAAVDSLAPPAG